MNFRQWLENISPIHQMLMDLRPYMAQAAQHVYNQWEQDNEGHDEEYGYGGICQEIAAAIVDVIQERFKHNQDYEVGTVSATCGEQHVWTMIAVGNEGFEIDVDYRTYETGGGYNWQKIPDVVFDPEDITITPVNHQDVRNALEYD